MISRFSYSEKCFSYRNSTNDNLNVEVNDKAKLRILRLLSGTCAITDDFTAKKYALKKNYLNFPFDENETYRQDNILNAFPEEIGKVDLSNYFKNFCRNNSYYEEIETELLNCLVAREQERYLEAFLFVYRIIEGISYSLPLIYISKQNSFKSSFKALQKCISKKDNDGELAFFKKFICEMLKNEDFFNSSVDIKLDDVPVEELKPKYYKIYKSKIARSTIDNDIEDEELAVSFIGFFEFLIEIRNRYFHFLQGTWATNIESSKIIYPDLFFKPLIDNAINWIGVILLEVIKYDLDNQ